MAVIYCGELNKVPYYIKEADLNIYSLQELAYFIYNNPMLISNNFINKSLIIFIKKFLKNQYLYKELNEYNNKNNSIVEKLVLLLRASNLYNNNDINDFFNYIQYLTKLDEKTYIKTCADSLFKLKKYNKAIKQYEKILDLPNVHKNIGYAYAKLLVFDKAMYYLMLSYDDTKDLQVLKDIYFCGKLSRNLYEFNKYKQDVSDDILADWEYEIVKLQLNAKNSQKILDIEDIFLMGENYIKDNVRFLINNVKEKYRYIG